MEYPKTNLDWLFPNTIFLTKHGSQAYGLATPESDTDYKGLCVPPRQYWLGHHSAFDQAEFHGDPDMVIFNIKKFFKLAADCNPNVIEVLFTDESDHVKCAPIAKRILENRDLFISRKAKYTFSGYARGQLKRIQGHYAWLKNPPKAPPTREQFGLRPNPLIPKEQYEALQAAIKAKLETWDVDLTQMDDAARINLQNLISTALVEQQITNDNQWECAARYIGLGENMIQTMKQERCYNNAVNQWRSYQTWLTDRNPKRAEIERKFGYDCKHGMHLYRLLKMCKEILQTGKVIVKRPDREEMLSIRNGSMSYEQLLEYADKMEKEMDELYLTSPLPKTPNHAKIEELLVDIVSDYLDGRP